MADALSSVRWLWVVAGGVVAQIALILVLYAVSALTAVLGWMRGDLVLQPAAYLIIPFLVGVFVARKAKAHFTLNGAMVGLLAALIFLPVLIATQTPYPLGQAVNALLEIVGGALGGGLVGHRTRRGIRKRARG